MLSLMYPNIAISMCNCYINYLCKVFFSFPFTSSDKYRAAILHSQNISILTGPFRGLNGTCDTVRGGSKHIGK